VGCLALFVRIEIELLITTEPGRQSSRKLLRSVISACRAGALDSAVPLPERSLALRGGFAVRRIVAIGYRLSPVWLFVDNLDLLVDHWAGEPVDHHARQVMPFAFDGSCEGLTFADEEGKLFSEGEYECA
jgi:hypothetical protein